MRFKKLLIITLSYLVSIGFYAQSSSDKFRLEIDAPAQGEKVLYFANYWQGDTYKLDSCQLTIKGKGVIEVAVKDVPAGQYVIYIEPDVRLEMLLDNGQDNIKVSIPKDLSKSTVQGSPDTEGYWAYLNAINKLLVKKEALNEKLDSAEKQSQRKKIQTELDALNSDIEAISWDVVNNNKGTWLSTFVKGSIAIDLPPNLMQPSTKRADIVEYVQIHYFDNLDMTDVRLQRTNYFYSLIESYINNWIPQDWDSVTSAYSNLVAKTKPNKESFDAFLSAMLNKSLSSSIMGMENVWTRLAEDYIFDKEVDIDDTTLSELRSKYEKIKLNRIGMFAQDLKMSTIDGDSLNLLDIDAEYIILEFYSTTCGYCKEDMTYMAKEFYPRYKDKGVKVVAFTLSNSKESWAQFIKDTGMDEFYNCSDPGYKTEYWMKYDTSRVPMNFIIDKNKKIVGKGVRRDNLEKLFKYLIKDNGNN